MNQELPDRYLEGLRLFNAEEFYECHDVLEELWADVLGEEKKFYQGLIQASVALFHFGNENFGGARKLYLSARNLLDAYPAHYMGIDLEKFLADFKYCFQELLDARDRYPTDIELRDDRVPKIEFSTDQSAA
jgi:predicted metal-dependent hydrolase